MDKLALSGLLLASAAGQPAEHHWFSALRGLPLAVVRGGPSLAPAWSANIVENSGLSTPAIGTFQYDKAQSRWRASGCMNITLFHAAGDLLCQDTLMRNISGQPYGSNQTLGRGDGAVCKVLNEPYSDLFSVLAITQKTGTSVVDGMPCDLWQGSYVHGQTNISASACVTADGVPRDFNFSSGIAYKAASKQRYRFSNVSVGPQADEVFAPSEACATRYPTPPCPVPAGKETVTLDLYRVHSKAEPASLSNRNLGDGLGDMAFFCDFSAPFDDSQLVTRWTVQAISSWGQYAYCIYQQGKNTCLGSSGNHVGREGALGLSGGSLQGQCSKNTEVGSWYSFPAEGECPQGAPVGTNGCTWSAVPSRTVSAACILKDRGLKKACASEQGHAPMLKSEAIFVAALASADPWQGGCPDVAASQQANLVVV